MQFFDAVYTVVFLSQNPKQHQSWMCSLLVSENIRSGSSNTLGAKSSEPRMFKHKKDFFVRNWITKRNISLQVDPGSAPEILYSQLQQQDDPYEAASTSEDNPGFRWVGHGSWAPSESAP